MNKYLALKEKHQKEVNEFPMFFAFSQEQFEEGKAKLGVTDNTELVDIGYGGFIRESDKQAYIDMHKRMDAEQKEAMQDEEYCYWMFRYELSNMEYIISQDLDNVLDACSLTADEVFSNPVLSKILEKARKDYLNSVNDC